MCTLLKLQLAGAEADSSFPSHAAERRPLERFAFVRSVRLSRTVTVRLKADTTYYWKLL